jgi:hypothetical protein
MTMTDINAVTMRRRSTFDRTPPDFSDDRPTNLDSLTASLDYLTLCFCEPGASGIASSRNTAPRSVVVASAADRSLPAMRNG